MGIIMSSVIEIKAPNNVGLRGDPWDIRIFLAGAIDMGEAEEWQSRIVEHFQENYRRNDSKFRLVFLNPRRNDWDSSWKQTPEDVQFSTQVAWELKGIAICDLMVMYLPAGSKAPISLLELGLALGHGKELCIFCPDDFYRSGNVKITADFYGHNDQICSTFDELISELEYKIENIKSF